MTTKDLLEELGSVKKQANKLYKEYKNLLVIEAGLKQELILNLQEIGLKSIKGEKYSASISSRPNITVQSETAVIEWLKEAPNIEADAYIGLKVTPLKGLALQILKETGEVVPGTEYSSTESLTIKENKK